MTTQNLLEAMKAVIGSLPKKEMLPKTVVMKIISLEEMIDRLTFVFRGRTVHAGASAGVAILDTHSEAGRALEAADSAMYVRKAQRRHETNN